MGTDSESGSWSMRPGDYGRLGTFSVPTAVTVPWPWRPCDTCRMSPSRLTVCPEELGLEARAV